VSLLVIRPSVGVSRKSQINHSKFIQKRVENIAKIAIKGATPNLSD
jgi:hypothetical protein